MTPEQWDRFEREFKVFCDIHGLPDKWAYWPTYDWARWAFFKGRQHGESAADRRSASAYFEKIAIAMMTDEQAQASLERWMQLDLERGA
ncbi:hypothetical protein [Paraburkholderia sp. BL9I2N2]|uniref:hypothetical protein n=1 Tax=Paraburkholderia sp. BL9I2N2 TaxID=1938809 RepID=UPI00104C1E41|nr:hypothetical protein [Paraburkholderia sp. BL9I2N2]TCK87344.1 hypothetical protein B0G74_7883 [Paraburkholderia sp. BL9I2N2]